MEQTPKGFKKPTTGDANDLYQFVGDNMDLLEVELDKKANINHSHDYPVNSVNGKTGVVNLTATDVGAETPNEVQSKVDLHANRKDNPHAITKSQVGLGSVLNYGLATQLEAEEGTSVEKYMTPLRVKQAIEKLTSSPYHTGNSPPLNTKLFWIDISS